MFGSAPVKASSALNRNVGIVDADYSDRRKYQKVFEVIFSRPLNRCVTIERFA